MNSPGLHGEFLNMMISGGGDKLEIERNSAPPREERWTDSGLFCHDRQPDLTACTWHRWTDNPGLEAVRPQPNVCGKRASQS